MKTKYGNINLITEYPKNDHIIRQIVSHLQENKIFALAAESEAGEDLCAMIYNPSNMKALHTNGEVFIYLCAENFLDSIRLTLIAYPKFVAGDKFLNSQPVIQLLQ